MGNCGGSVAVQRRWAVSGWDTYTVTVDFHRFVLNWIYISLSSTSDTIFRDLYSVTVPIA